MPIKEQVSQVEAGKRLGISAQAVGVWCRRPGAPVGERGGKPFCRWPDFARWRERELDRQAREETIARLVGSDIKKSQERKLAAEAALAELALGKMLGNLVPVEFMREEVSRICQRLRAKLLAASGRHASTFVAIRTEAEAQAHLDDLVRDVMEALSAVGEELDAEDEAA